MNTKKLILPNNEVITPNNVLPFTKPDTTDGDDDWLAKLAVGTIFLTRAKKNPGFELMELEVMFKQGKAAQLADDKNKDVSLWVETARFSKLMELVQINLPIEENKE